MIFCLHNGRPAEGGALSECGAAADASQGVWHWTAKELRLFQPFLSLFQPFSALFLDRGSVWQIGRNYAMKRARGKQTRDV